MSLFWIRCPSSFILDNGIDFKGYPPNPQITKQHLLINETLEFCIFWNGVFRHQKGVFCRQKGVFFLVLFLINLSNTWISYVGPLFQKLNYNPEISAKLAVFTASKRIADWIAGSCCFSTSKPFWWEVHLFRISHMHWWCLWTNPSESETLNSQVLGFFRRYICLELMDALRSNVWSSATLAEGFQSSIKQPHTFLVKSEEDQELVDNFEARNWFSFNPLGKRKRVL